MMTDMNGSIKVSASGVAHAPYDIARFCITVSNIADNGATAKAGMRQTLDNVIESIDALVRADRARNKVMALRVDPHTVYDQKAGHVPRGYRASCKITFETRDVRAVGEIQDALTEHPQSQVASVEYGFENVESLREQALTNAWLNVQKRWYSQLVTLGLRATDYRLHSWKADYNEHERLSKVAAPEGSANPGIAAVAVSLEAFFTGNPQPVTPLGLSE